MNYQLASAIIKGKWAIDPLFAMNAAPLVADILNGKVEVEAPKAAAKIVDSSGSKQNAGTVGIINIQGSLMKNDQMCGPVGMATMDGWVKAMDASPDIDAIVLKIDSPGGTVDGTQSFATAVKNTQKPVITFVDGLMASAALWIGSSADEVFAGSEMDEVGSVGVLLSFADMQPYYEEKGVKFHTITASQSTEKVKMWEDIRNGKYDEYRKEFLDPIAETFIGAVKENRQGVKDEHLTGKVFMAKNVMGVFVDAIGTFDEAVNRALELASERKSAAEGKAALNKSMNMKYAKIASILGSDSMEFEADGSRTFSPEEMQAVETALNEEPAAQEPDTSALDTANARITELEAQLENLKNAPAAELKDTTEATDDAPVETGEFLSSRDIELYNLIKQ
jgi:protease-4